MPRLSKIGAAALAAFGWTGLQTVSASYLVVAGGGGGGTSSSAGGGGGAGGLLTGTASLNLTLSYTITVGAGGAGAPAAASEANGTNGANSSISTLSITSVGGGGGASGNVNGLSGGSGGGGGGGSSTTGGSATSGQGNAGGGGITGVTNNRPAGGGGGAGAVGGNASTNVGGNGGNGSASSISGSSVTYAGGGGGGNGGSGSSAGTGGTGGGGNGGLNVNGASGTANLGGGGGGTSYAPSGSPSGGQGGSGVVIISYPAPQKFGGGIVTTSGSNVIHTFNTSGTLTPLSSLTASYLIVAGGGGGGKGQNGSSGGGGAGGLLSGSGLTIDTNSNYLVTVGAGGASQTTTDNRGNSGSNSSFSIVTTTAVGGGGGGAVNTANGASGGSGGGGGHSLGTGGSGTSGQGYAGGNNGTNGGNQYPSGGGGGAGGVGANGSGTAAGNGGVGVASSISGTSTYYAGGGGGGYGRETTGGTGTGGTGGLGGGGNGTASTSAGNDGTANTGGGGGGTGQYTTAGGNGGAGGSGIVIISYPGSTQQMAGGTVTISGGNVIHTFTSSGYLTPIKYVNNSLRLRSSASAYLNRTPATAGNRKTWTYSGWIKRGKLGTDQTIFGAGYSTSPWFILQFDSSDVLDVSFTAGVSAGTLTTAVYRDPAAWYHIVCAVDTTQATASNRMKLYVNGVQVTSFSSTSYPSQNTDYQVNNTVQHYISNGAWYFDGYMAEVQLIDGQQLTPNSFGTFNSYGVWQPITYGGSYGTNGFYLPFSNTTSTTALGYDFSPNGNNWTPNNIASTSSPTNTVVFKSSSSWTAPAGVSSVNYLVVAGGGSGGGVRGLGAGGGAGGLLTGTLSVTSGSTYTVTVGAGGVDSSAANGGVGGNSVFSSITTYGGGTGAEAGVVGYNGGSGGGGSYNATAGKAGGTGVSGQGNAGGTGYTGNSPYGMGGGGGAGAVGGNAGGAGQGGNGGAGSTVSSALGGGTYAGGGGGASNTTAGTGGSGGGGNGSANPSAPTAGTANTGGGGGGDGRQIQGGNGGSGIVILSYTVDSMTDVPTLTSATAANYCVINPLDKGTGLNLTNGNLQHTADSSGNWYQARCTFAFPTTGKFYWELTFNAGTNSWCSCSIAPSTTALTMGWGPSTYANVYGMTLDGTLYTNNTSTGSYGSSFASGDIFMVAFDRDNSKIYFGKNGTWFNSSNPATQTNPAATGITTSVNLFPLVGGVNSSGGASNFGQQPFVYTPPTGFVALNTYNL